MLQIQSLRLLPVQLYWIKSFPSLQKRLEKHQPPLIEDEIKKCLETNVAPIKEAIDNQQKPLIQMKRKYVNSISGSIDLTNK